MPPFTTSLCVRQDGPLAIAPDELPDCTWLLRNAHDGIRLATTGRGLLLRLGKKPGLAARPRVLRDDGAMLLLRSIRVHLNHAHGWLYSHSGGRFGGSVGSHRVLLLTTTGRHSGRKRRTPVQYECFGEEIVVVAAGGGSPSPPAWWLNLESHPEVEVRTGADVWPGRAETAGPDRRAELWPALTAANPSIASAQEKAGRQLPVVVLSRRDRQRT